jgi:hypothetical protein
MAEKEKIEKSNRQAEGQAGNWIGKKKRRVSNNHPHRQKSRRK